MKCKLQHKELTEVCFPNYFQIKINEIYIKVYTLKFIKGIDSLKLQHKELTEGLFSKLFSDENQ